MEEALDRLAERHERADENGEHNSKSSPTLATGAPEEECDAEWDRRQRVTEVMDEVRE